MKTPRRGFLLSVAAAPLVPALASAQAAPPPSPTAPPGTPPDPVTDALLEVVKRRYGAHLEPGDLEGVRRALREAHEMGDRLKAGAPLGNPDEPVTVFEARPRREGKGGRR